MIKFSVVSWVIAGCLMLVGTACGQGYPGKPIRIVTSSAGGGTDFVSRLIANGISGSLGQNIVVENRSTVLTGGVVAQSAPDGYTLLLNGTSFWLAPLLQDKLPYDAVRDFAPISLLTASPTLIVVHTSLPVKSVKELIVLAKARPGALNYGSSTVGAPTHLAAELFKSMTGVNIVRISYKGNGPSIIALVSGEVPLMFTAAGSVTTHIAAGRLRALAVASAKPTPLAPGLPTVAATVPGYETASTYGLLAPAGTPPAIINRLNREVVQFINSAGTRERLFKSGIETVGSSPQEFAAIIASDLKKWGKLIQEAGIRVE